MPIDAIPLSDRLSSFGKRHPSRHGIRSKGLSAESAVASRYLSLGAEIVEERFRGGVGEVDLIVKHSGVLIFIEVKFGPDRETAMARVTPDKARRLRSAAESYLARHELGLDSEIRFDVALVDPLGRTEIIENALWFD